MARSPVAIAERLRDDDPLAMQVLCGARQWGGVSAGDIRATVPGLPGRGQEVLRRLRALRPVGKPDRDGDHRITKLGRRVAHEGC